VIDGHRFLNEELKQAVLKKGDISYFVREFLLELLKGVSSNATITDILPKIQPKKGTDLRGTFGEENIPEEFDQVEHENWIQLFPANEKDILCNILENSGVGEVQLHANSNAVCDIVVFSKDKYVVMNLHHEKDKLQILETLEEGEASNIETIKLYLEVEAGNISFKFSLHPFRFTPVAAVLDTIEYELRACRVTFTAISVHFQNGEEVIPKQGERHIYLADFFASGGGKKKLYWQVRLTDGGFPPVLPHKEITQIKFPQEWTRL
jgi:hypothetical protein